MVHDVTYRPLRLHGLPCAVCRRPARHLIPAGEVVHMDPWCPLCPYPKPAAPALPAKETR